VNAGDTIVTVVAVVAVVAGELRFRGKGFDLVPT
jgi:hypothetical protein